MNDKTGLISDTTGFIDDKDTMVGVEVVSNGFGEG